jgi:hypothetical protein
VGRDVEWLLALIRKFRNNAGNNAVIISGKLNPKLYIAGRISDVALIQVSFYCQESGI